MDGEDTYTLDEIDREILQILTSDPRMPYSEIASRLEETGHGMSSEGVRHRVNSLFDESSIFLLNAPHGNQWEMVRLSVSVKDRGGSVDSVFEDLSETDFWLVCRGLGMFDIHAAGTVPSVGAAEELVNEVRSLDDVDTVDYFIETDRQTNVNNYMVR
jgi:DNA-binding Lrp family transcriptional regulator